MKTIRKIAEKRITLLSLLAIFGFANATTYSLNNDVKISIVEKKINSENLFRELFFCDGNVQNSVFKGLPFFEEYLGQLNRFSKEKQLDRQKFVNQIIGIIKIQNKNYFDNFDKVLATKNPYLIKKELSNSYKVISNAISASTYTDMYKKAEIIYQEKYSKTPIRNEADFKKITKSLTKDLTGQSSYENGSCVAAEVAVYVAAVAVESIGYFNMALRTTVFLWTKGKVFSDSLELASTDSNLLSDEIVARIIEHES